MTSAEERPALRPEEVSGREFSVARKGYDRAEVRAFLETVASDLAAASELVTELERLAARAAVDSNDAEPSNAETLLEAVAAEAWRDEVLADLDRRRRELNGEVVRLRAGRDRLRDDLAEVAGELAEQLRRLDGSLQAARSAGDVAEQRVRAEDSRSAEEWRAELEAARLAGFVTVGAAAAAGDPAGDGGGAPATPRSDDAEAVEVGELFARLRAERSGERPGGDPPQADS
ncbi:MAG: DivIVA domain-containing protein [bacterium]|nr:DivIVA domain-containing protein [bacterium]